MIARQIGLIEFGDQGSALDTSQRAAALEVIRKANRPAAIRLHSRLAQTTRGWSLSKYFEDEQGGYWGQLLYGGCRLSGRS
jgi:hypothetical protein